MEDTSKITIRHTTPSKPDSTIPPRQSKGHSSRGAAVRPMLARYNSNCISCNQPISKGDEVRWLRVERKVVHPLCGRNLLAPASEGDGNS